jgi:hypothetical protein
VVAAAIGIALLVGVWPLWRRRDEPRDERWDWFFVEPYMWRFWAAIVLGTSAGVGLCGMAGAWAFAT